MANLNELQSELEGMNDVVEGVVRVIDQLADEVEGSIGNQAATQAAIDKIRSYKNSLAEAIVRGTDADPNKDDPEQGVSVADEVSTEEANAAKSPVSGQSAAETPQGEDKTSDADVAKNKAKTL